MDMLVLGAFSFDLFSFSALLISEECRLGHFRIRVVSKCGETVVSCSRHMLPSMHACMHSGTMGADYWRIMGISKKLKAVEESIACDPSYVTNAGRERTRLDFDDFDSVPQKFPCHQTLPEVRPGSLPAHGVSIVLGAKTGSSGKADQAATGNSCLNWPGPENSNDGRDFDWADMQRRASNPPGKCAPEMLGCRWKTREPNMATVFTRGRVIPGWQAVSSSGRSLLAEARPWSVGLSLWMADVALPELGSVAGMLLVARHWQTLVRQWLTLAKLLLAGVCPITGSRVSPESWLVPAEQWLRPPLAECV
ncbi:COP9 signalosome complex subunit 3 [Nymphaea thermarum]|nr:COP9 signalosome complex subunit 3 [Nymphaea thermarum]